MAADNSDLVENDINDLTYTGARLSALINLTDDWDVLLSHTRQEIESDGVFFADPDLGDLEIQRYTDEMIEDDIENTSWTFTGRMAGLDVVYTGAFTERTTDQVIGYTDYLFVGQYLPYYICDYSVTYGDQTGTCYAPNLYAPSHSEAEVTTHEIRVSSDPDNSMRYTAGVFSVSYTHLTLPTRS